MQAISLKKVGLAAAAVLAVMATALATANLSAAQSQEEVSYGVTIENLSTTQPLTPPLVVAHSDQADVYEVGQAASEQLQQLAENGNLDPLTALLGGSGAVFDVASGDAPIMPGESATVSVRAPAGSVLSAVMMLICTNDGFTGVDSVSLPASGSETVDADAYDAGTEMNTEDFADLVPPCQALVGVTSDDEGTGETNPTLAEGGVITAHAGVQGGTDLTTADHGWTDPVARITISAEASGLPDSGGPPPDGGSSSLWAILLGIGGAALVVAGGTIFVASRQAAG